MKKFDPYILRRVGFSLAVGYVLTFVLEHEAAFGLALVVAGVSWLAQNHFLIELKVNHTVYETERDRMIRTATIIVSFFMLFAIVTLRAVGTGLTDEKVLLLAVIHVFANGIWLGSTLAREAFIRRYKRQEPAPGLF
jgi:hypothetical protein